MSVIPISSARRTTETETEYAFPPAPVLVSSIPTGGGADVHVYQDSDGSLSSDCTGCGEYAWALNPEFAHEHAATCIRPPRPLLAAA
ncbi:hypothetical protein ACFY9H_31380 [Streptomyces bacillaris]|uniref:hypothetical protein n=1 Tax=Streptomyces bacillaris TaxID=68179 RepID=UPI0036EE5244